MSSHFDQSQRRVSNNYSNIIVIIMVKAIISYRPRYTDEQINKLPHFSMAGGAGYFAPTVTVPKYHGPAKHGFELYLKDVQDNLEILFEEGNIHGTARFTKTLQCLGGIAKTEFKKLMATANYQPAAARTDADWQEIMKDLTSKLHTNTYLGNDLQEGTKDFEFHQCKTDPDQGYPDNITTQENRLDEIDDWAENRTHYQGNLLDDAGKMRRMIKRIPVDYVRFLRVTRGIDPFDPVNTPTREDVIQILDEYWKDCKERVDRISNKSQKRNRHDQDDQNSRKKSRFDECSVEGGEYSDIESEIDSKSEENNQEPRPNDYVELNGKECKWKSSVLNPKCDEFDWIKSKDFYFEQKCKNAPWYRDIFSEELSRRRAQYQSGHNQSRARNYRQGRPLHGPPRGPHPHGPPQGPPQSPHQQGPPKGQPNNQHGQYHFNDFAYQPPVHGYSYEHGRGQAPSWWRGNSNQSSYDQYHGPSSYRGPSYARY